MPREIKAPEVTIESVKSWDGKHELQFSEKSHRYKLNGKPCPGVTTAVKSGYPTSVGLIKWMCDQTAQALFKSITVPNDDGYYPRESFWPITEEVRKDLFKAAKTAHEATATEAADIGTVTHSYAELHSLGKQEEADALLRTVHGVEKYPIIESCVVKYLEWASGNIGKLVLAEALVASPTHFYCGKFDRLDNVNGKLRLRDYKTSSSIYVDQFIQMAAYRLAIKEWLNLDVEELEVLRFGKEDGSFEHLVISDPKEVQDFTDQAIRCRKTHEFRKYESDERFDWRKK